MLLTFYLIPCLRIYFKLAESRLRTKTTTHVTPPSQPSLTIDSLDYSLYYQLSASESPIKIGLALSEITRNKQTNGQTEILKYGFLM